MRKREQGNFQPNVYQDQKEESDTEAKFEQFHDILNDKMLQQPIEITLNCKFERGEYMGEMDPITIYNKPVQAQIFTDLNADRNNKNISDFNQSNTNISTEMNANISIFKRLIAADNR